MDFGLRAPEINSGLMYAGPGADSMISAAGAWDLLAAQLHTAASSFSSVISGLTVSWLGPSSAAMIAAARPYITWLHATATQSEFAGAQAKSAAAAYEAAFAAMVPPPVIAANRSALASLVATNIAGQNTAAIAVTEAQYAEMWAQDAAAMYGYAGQSAAASRVAPFTPPQRNTDAGGSAAQSAAAASANSAGGGTQSTMSQIPATLQSLATPAAAPPTDPTLQSVLDNDVLNPFGSLSPLEKGLEFFEFSGTGGLPARNALVSSTLGFALATRGFTTGELPVPLIPGVPLPPVATAASTSAVSAAVSQAGTLSGLSVPPSWAAATPTVRLAAAALQSAGTAGAAVVTVAGESTLVGQMALASVLGSALGGTACRAATRPVDKRDRDSKPDDSESGDTSGKTSGKLERVLAELSQNPESVQHWHTDKTNLESLLQELSTKPGVHAVHLSKHDNSGPKAPKPRWG